MTPYPQHYADKAGEKMTAIVNRLLRKMGQSWHETGRERDTRPFFFFYRLCSGSGVDRQH